MAPQPNLPPQVSTGPNQNVSSGDFVKLSGTVTDEASPKLMWTQTEGPTSDISLQNSDQREARLYISSSQESYEAGFQSDSN